MNDPQHDTHGRRSTGGSWLGRRSLAGRLFLLTSLATVLIMAAIAAVMAWNSRSVAVDTVQREIASALDGAQDSLHLVFASASSRGEDILPVLERELGGIPVPNGATERSASGDEVPIFKVNDTVLNGDISALMRVNGNTGADPAIMARVGTKWVRIATLLKDDQGKPRFNSVVDPKDLLAVTLDSGKPFNGLVQRNGKWYAMSIKPLKDKSGAVYGGFSVRVSVDAQVQDLLASMANTRVARYGSLGVLQRTADKNGWVPAAGEKLVGGLSEAERTRALQTMSAADSGFATFDASDLGEAKYIAWSQVPGWNWIVYGAGDQDEFLAESNQALFIQLALMLLGTLLISLLVWWVAQHTIRPVRQVVDALDMLERGDLTADLPMVPEHSNNEIHSLLGHLSHTQNSLERTIAAVRVGVDEIHLAATEISAGNTDLSSRTEEQAASLQQTAASMEELAATVKQNTDHARTANAVAGAVSTVARRGEAAVADVVQTMARISTSSNKIGEIVGVIDSIAFQTNILALNAAVEAARAGEEGRGFAVVAAEVRALAQRSAQAAGEIKQLIIASVSEVDSGAQQVAAAGATMSELLSSVDQVTGIMKEISEASEEQFSGISEVNRAVSQMDEVTQQNAALVEEAAAAAASLQSQADQLAAAVGVFITRRTLDQPSGNKGVKLLGR